ncbi:MAG: restriction endonuclease subunit S [Thermoanaerobaculia bacterium]
MFIDQWTKLAPKHWTREKLKYLASLRSGESIAADSIKDQGDFPVYGGNGLRGYTGEYTHDGEFVLIGRQGALCGNVNYAKNRFWASEHAVVITRLGDHDLRWLGELLRYLDLNRLSQSAAQPGISAEEVSNVLLAVPPAEEQRAISTYLTSETARLDALVAAKQRVQDLLAEKRNAIIATAVTRGLDPMVRLRDSGVPWLGKVPAHWEHRNLRFCCTSIQTGGTPAPEFLDYGGEDGLEWLTPGDFSESLVPQRSTRRVAPGALSAGDLKVFPVGTILVVGIGATLGKVGLLPRPASANQQVNALIPRQDIDSSFLAFEMTVLAELLRVSANTATLPILNQQRMGDVPVLVPPLGEQHAIVDRVAHETAKLDAVRAATERTIALLKERRSALIAAAVTGQLDVGAAA